MPNPVVHFEIIGTDGPALRDFYASTFGWQMQVPPEMDYGLVENKREGISGGVRGAETASAMFYIQVDDLQAHLDKIAQAGGKTVTPITKIDGMATFAHFADPQGNVVGLVDAREFYRVRQDAEARRLAGLRQLRRGLAPRSRSRAS